MTESEPNSELDNNKSVTENTTIPLRRQLRSRIEELEAKESALTAEVEAERDKRLRLAAEYDNYRRRTSQEFRVLYETASERILVKLLPVQDDFERMMSHSDADLVALKQGMELIFRKLQSIFESEGVVSVPSVGAQFDSTLHEAVAQMPVPNTEPGTVIAEVERGYRLKEKIIRHAKVMVASATEGGSDNDEATHG